MSLRAKSECVYLISGYLDTRVETSRKSSVGSVNLNTSAIAAIAPHSRSVFSPYTHTHTRTRWKQFKAVLSAWIHVLKLSNGASVPEFPTEFLMLRRSFSTPTRHSGEVWILTEYSAGTGEWVTQRTQLLQHSSIYMWTHGRQFPEQEFELIGLLDHPLCSLSPLICIPEGDSFLHHCFDVLYHDSAQGRAGHLLGTKHHRPRDNTSTIPHWAHGGSAAILPGWRVSWSCWNRWNNPRRSHRWYPQHVSQSTTSWSAARLGDAG